MAGKKAKVGTVHMCIDRILTGDQKIRAMQLAIAENKKNQPKIKRLPGVSAHAIQDGVTGRKDVGRWPLAEDLLPGRINNAKAARD